MKVKVCPACDSQNISKFDLFKFEQRCGLFKEQCNNCGYVGPMTVMEKADADKLKVKPIKKKK